MPIPKSLYTFLLSCVQMSVHSQTLPNTIPGNSITLLGDDAAASLISLYLCDFRISKTAIVTKPLDSELVELQSHLPDFLKQSRPDIFAKLDKLYFQVVCVQDGKERMLLINSLDKLIAYGNSTWRTTSIVVDGGGNSVWRICYSLQTKTFSKLSVNGPT